MKNIFKILFFLLILINNSLKSASAVSALNHDTDDKERSLKNLSLSELQKLSTLLCTRMDDYKKKYTDDSDDEYSEPKTDAYQTLVAQRKAVLKAIELKKF